MIWLGQIWGIANISMICCMTFSTSRVFDFRDYFSYRHAVATKLEKCGARHTNKKSICVKWASEPSVVFSEMGVGTNGLAQTLGPRRGSEVSGMGQANQ